MAPSHLLKLKRAKEHFIDLEELVSPSRVRRQYPVTERHETERKQPRWVYRLDLRSAQPGDAFSLIYGDFLFNIRSALDHLMVSLVPKNRETRTQFPIFTSDPLARDETTRDYLDADAASRWKRWTKGLPSKCVAELHKLQPYEAEREYSKPAKNHAISILSALQNADKHRNLIEPLVVLGPDLGLVLNGVSTTPTAPQMHDLIEGFPHGTVINVSETQMRVQVEGSALVGVEGLGKIFPYDIAGALVIGYLENEVFPRLQRFIRR